MNDQNYTIAKFPSSRVATFDVGKIGRNKHHISGLLEVDITLARRKIRKLKQSGKHVSFLSWF